MTLEKVNELKCEVDRHCKRPCGGNCHPAAGAFKCKAAHDDEENSLRDIEIIITSDGKLLAPWWTPTVQEIMEEVGNDLYPKMGHFCG